MDKEKEDFLYEKIVQSINVRPFGVFERVHQENIKKMIERHAARKKLRDKWLKIQKTRASQ